MKPVLPILAAVFGALVTSALTDDRAHEIVLRADGIERTRADFGSWLVDHCGIDYVSEYMDRELVRHEAVTNGLMPSEERVEEAWLAERQMIADRNFRGSLERMEADLVRKGTTLADYAQRRKEAIAVEIAAFDMARRQRAQSEEKLEKRYRDIFGAYGEAIAVDVLFFSAYAGVNPDGARPDVEVLRRAAMVRAGRAADALRAGRPIAELRADSDPVNPDLLRKGFVHEGRVAQYRKNLLGPEVERIMGNLDEVGEVAGPIQVWDGAWVIQLVRREPMSFEAAREELQRIMDQDDVTSEELGNVHFRLREKYGAEVLLR